ncbi:Myb-like DNA-binding domain-containing protein 6 [Elsinoe australis]|uniref:Myb-like DNA-binding domain-containing protein 6 n=1 Tax=Elsinoe australis TaxID=40998 RepID=A0A4U7AUN7_9PEZI|nr:Myb-like DNA-binding domain-containing protein 6 [Elsinoe australis]
MGNSSSQLVGAEQSQSQDLPTEDTTGSAAPTKHEQLVKTEPVTTSALTPPPTGQVQEEASDSYQSHPSVDGDVHEEEEDLRLQTHEAITHPTEEKSVAYKDSISSTLEFESGAIAQLDGAAAMATQFSTAYEGSQLTPEERRAKAERKRLRDEKRARKETRRLVRAMRGDDSQVQSTPPSKLELGQSPSAPQPTLESALPVDDVEVPETQPDMRKKTPEEVYAQEDSYDMDDPGTQLRMEAERAQMLRSTAPEEKSSPLQQREKPKKSKSNKRRLDFPEDEDAPVEAPVETPQPKPRKSKKRAPDRSELEQGAVNGEKQPRRKKAKTSKGTKERQQSDAEDAEEAQEPTINGTSEVEARHRRTNSEGSAAETSPKPLKTSTTDPPEGVNEFARPSKRKSKAGVRESMASSKASPSKKKSQAPTASGPFTADEIAEVDRAVKSYCKENDLTEKGFREMMQSNTTTRTLLGEVLSWINDYVPDRSRKSVRQFCQRKYTSAHRGPWTPDEDDELKEAYEEKPGNWVYIASMLGRLAEDCRDRWRDFVGNPNRQEGVWSEDEEKELENAIAECVSRMRQERDDAAIDVEDGELEALVNWSVVSDMLGKTRSRLQCRYKWAKLRNRQVRIEQTGTPRPRKGGKRKSNAAHIDDLPGNGSQWTAINSSTPATGKRAKKTSRRSTDGAEPSSSKLKKPRRSSGIHSSKKYKSTVRVAADDDDDEIVDDSQQDQQHADSMEIYDIPPSSPMGQQLASIRHGGDAEKYGAVMDRPVDDLEDIEADPEDYDAGESAAAASIHDENDLQDDGDVYDNMDDGLVHPDDSILEGSFAGRSSRSPKAQPERFEPRRGAAERDSLTPSVASPASSSKRHGEEADEEMDIEEPTIHQEQGPSPSTSSNAAPPRPRTPPDEKHWLPGDIYLMLHELMDAYGSGEFNDLDSFMRRVRRVCGERHYTAEDRITQYWKIVKEGGFREGLRRNIFSCIEWLSDRHLPRVLAQTSHGNVTYGLTLDEIPREVYTPPATDDRINREALEQNWNQQRLHIRQARASSSVFAEDDPLSVRDFAIDSECEKNQGPRKPTRGMMLERAQEQRDQRIERRLRLVSPARAERRTTSELGADDLLLDHWLGDGWEPWQIEAVARKRWKRKIESFSLDYQHPEPLQEFEAMSPAERHFHSIKWTAKDADCLDDFDGDDEIYRLAREEVQRAARRTAPQNPSSVAARSPTAQDNESKVASTPPRAPRNPIGLWLMYTEEAETPPDDQLEVIQDGEVVGDGASEDNDEDMPDSVNGDSESAVDAPLQSDHDDVVGPVPGSPELGSPELGEEADDTWQSSLPQDFRILAKMPRGSSGKKRNMTYSRADKRRSGMSSERQRINKEVRPLNLLTQPAFTQYDEEKLTEPNYYETTHYHDDDIPESSYLRPQSKRLPRHDSRMALRHGEDVDEDLVIESDSEAGGVGRAQMGIVSDEEMDDY